MTPIRIVTIGCGPRGRGYSEFAARDPQGRYRLVAAADPRAERTAHLAQISGIPDFRSFASDADCFAAGRLGELAIIATQDAYHIEPARRALELGYHVLLEKPIGTDLAAIAGLQQLADRVGRRLMICHVLRYAPAFVLVKRLIDSGIIGAVVDIEHTEGVGAWHQVHSYVRGHWAVTARSSPMILAKCCHDADLISWWMGQPCTAVSSFGSLDYFTAAHAPAGATARCAECPHQGTCHYDAQHYIRRERGWLACLDQGLHDHGSDEEIRSWLRRSPWGRCAWHCDNTAVDRQVVAMQFTGGGVATLTMTAFDSGRHTTLRGTLGVIRAGDAVKSLSGHDAIVDLHDGQRSAHDAEVLTCGYASHGGGDGGLVHALAEELAKPDPRSMTTGIHASVESHRIALAAEESRLAGGRPVMLS